MARLITIFLLVIPFVMLSQHHRLCGTDNVMKNYINTTRFKNEQAKILKLENYNVNTKIIPIVFHIIHDGDPIGVNENVSVDQIMDAVNIINEDFNNQNSDLENVIDDFQNIIGNPNIEFRLAKLDPDGNCTSGINRIVSSMTTQANDCIKDLIAWDDSQYVNIWVVESIDSSIGAAAYTYLPGTLWDEVEGIIINHEYLGSIGSSNNTPYKRHTLSHEFGHYFNLQHTWGWGTNGEVENCNYDDNVSDTPNTIGAYSTCNLAQQSCGNLDNIQNFMDYSSCTCMFSVGQVNRMQDCLNSSVSQRNNLWTNSNLWLTGTHDNYNAEACLPSVDFYTSSVDRICANSPISFISNSESVSSNSVFYWSFPGSDIESSSEINPQVTYSSSGQYDVTLNIISTGGESSLTKSYYVYDPPNSLNENFQNTQFPNNPEPNLAWSILSPNNEYTWTRSPISSTSTTGSVRIRSRYYNCNKKHKLFSPTLNLSSYALGSGNPLKLKFDMAYGKRNNQTDDLLVISFSKDCGNTWQVRATWDTDDLITTNFGNVGNNFIPNQTEWIEKEVNIQSAAGEDDVIIKFEFSGENGSYLYIDNVSLTGEWIGIHDGHEIEDVKLIKQLDILGRESLNNSLQIYFFSDGSVVKKYKLNPGNN